jgi:hypothetical protein
MGLEQRNKVRFGGKEMKFDLEEERRNLQCYENNWRRDDDPMERTALTTRVQGAFHDSMPSSAASLM